MSSSAIVSLNKLTTFSQEIAALDSLRSQRRSNITSYPSVSVLVSTLRSDDLTSLLQQLKNQTLPSFELVIGLHTISLNATHKKLISDLKRRNISVMTYSFGEESTLGTILSTLAIHSSGAYIAKMDDDDYYGPEHLHDLLDAAIETGADRKSVV